MVVFQKKCKIKEMKPKKIRFGLLFLAILIAVGLKIWLSKGNRPVEEYVPHFIPSPLPKTSKLQRTVARARTPTHIQEFLTQKYPGNWKFQKDEEGRIRSIMGGMISGVGKSLESALLFAHTISPFFDVPTNQILSSSAKFVGGPRTTSYDFQQTVQGYPVFRGRMIMFSRNQDGAVYLINSDLKHVDPIQTERTLSSQEAMRILEERFAHKSSKEIHLDSPQRVVWADTKPHELAWSFIVEFLGENPGRYRLIVGMVTSSILLEQNLVMYEAKSIRIKDLDEQTQK